MSDPFIIDCMGMGQINTPPPNITRLSIHNGTRLKSLPQLPNLRALHLWNCRDFTAEEYAVLPPTLKELHIYDMYVRDITVLPQWITELHLFRTYCEELPAGTFPNLNYLNVSYSTGIHTICVPPRVVDCSIIDIPSLTKIVAFSSETVDMRLTDLPHLTELPSFPSTLKSLWLSDVPVTMLPPFPNINVKVHLFGTHLPLELLDIDSTDYNGLPYIYNDPNNPTWLARINPILEEYERKGRIQQRSRLIRPELLVTAHSPERVAKWLGDGDGNWALVDTILGIA